MLQSDATPLHHASYNGHLDVMRYLIEKCGADVNGENMVSEFDMYSCWINGIILITVLPNVLIREM
jgi:ankyrin repeat protein